MSKVFADTHYWIAVLNPKDQWHFQAVEMRKLLDDVQIVTTETVLIEVLNYFCENGSEIRLSVAESVRAILEDDEILYLSQQPETLLNGIEFYEMRADKDYSLTDCISMLTMRSLNLREILTHDKHFDQEGFTVLL